MSDLETKDCVYCGAGMPEKASLCPNCKYHQVGWKNWLTVIGGLTGVAALLASSLAFIINNVTETVEQTNWTKSVKIHYLQTSIFPAYQAVLSNAGVDEVYIKEIVIYHSKGNVELQINAPIRPKKFVLVGEIKDVREKYHDFVANKTGMPTEAMLGFTTTAGDNCFLATFYTSDASDIERMARFYTPRGLRLTSKPVVEAHLSYFDARTGEKYDAGFSAVETYTRSTNPECGKIQVD